MIKAVLFDIDDTLYDSSMQSELARKNAVNAMIEAGMKASHDEGAVKLQKIVEKHGSNYDHHFDELLKEVGQDFDARIIAAGIVAYHNTKIAYLRPYYDATPVLIKLKSMGMKLGVITNGRAVKQWEKIIRLGFQHFFDIAIISEEEGIKKPEEAIFRKGYEKLGVKASECLYVGDRPKQDISGAGRAGMKTALLKRGRHSLKTERSEEKADFEIKCLDEILEIVENG